MMPPFEYHTTGIREIELVRPLWVQLNGYHHDKSQTFRQYYEQVTFEDRMACFEKLATAGQLRVDLAFDTATSRYVGYCISSFSDENTGEIESIFIEERYRSQGIGSALVTRALEWFDSKGSVRNRVSVGNGNEEAWGFYAKFGFYPRMTVLEQKK
jgi:diamine N-acetyltransferase